MPKSSANEMGAEYAFSQFKGGVRGPYYQQAKAETNLVLIDPDLAKVFSDGQSVNRALRLLVEAASDATIASGFLRKRKKILPRSLPKKSTRVTAGR